MSETTERNKEIVRRYQDAYNSNNLDVLDELLAPDWKTQAFPTDLMEQTVENAKVVHRSLLEAFPDLHIRTHELVAEGDVVVQSYTVQGTHQGEMAGLPPTGKSMAVGGVSIFEIRDGRIVRHEAFSDFIDVLVQLGADIPAEWAAFAHRAVDA
ncbi:MAG TPA: ester cyclase [Acidimicrobiia bacterium]|jgi:steroid delta-isomerase-like uncharacterized protein|nr:ester cyclase [Acidimicrobiia bacterium]